MLHECIGLHPIGRSDLQLGRIAIALNEGLVLHEQRQTGALVHHRLDDAHDLHLITLIRVDHEEGIADVDAELLGGGVVDEDFAGPVGLGAVDKRGRLTYGLLSRVEGLHTGRAPAGLERLGVFVGHHDRLAALHVYRANVGVGGDVIAHLLIQLRAVFLLAHGRIHAGKCGRDSGVERVRQRVGEHEGARNERGTQHHRQQGQGKAQLVRENIAHGDRAHGVLCGHALALDFCHHGVDGLHGRIHELIN